MIVYKETELRKEESMQMKRRVGYVICLAASMCLLCSCKTEVTNEFVDNIRSSIDNQKESGEEIELMGKITKIDDKTITVSLMQMNGDMSFDRGAGDIGEFQKPKEKFGKEPEATSTYHIDPSSWKEPIEKICEPEETERPENMKPQGVPKEIGTELELTIDEDTELVQEDETIMAEDLKKGYIIYIVINGEQVTKIRVSGRTFMRDVSLKPGMTNPPEKNPSID